MRQKSKSLQRASGQSTVEYILLVTAVLAVIITLTNTKNSLFRNKLTNTINMTMAGMENETLKLTNGILNSK